MHPGVLFVVLFVAMYVAIHSCVAICVEDRNIRIWGAVGLTCAAVAIVCVLWCP